MPQIKLIIKEGGNLTFDVDGYEENPNECENVIKLLEAKLVEQGLEVKGMESIRHPASMRRVPLPKKKQTQEME